MDASARSYSLCENDELSRSPALHAAGRQVRLLDDTHLPWVAAFGGRVTRRTRRSPSRSLDERVARRITDGEDNVRGETFHLIDDAHTRVSGARTALTG